MVGSDFNGIVRFVVTIAWVVVGVKEFPLIFWCVLVRLCEDYGIISCVYAVNFYLY